MTADSEVRDLTPEAGFRRIVAEGRDRLSRSFASLVATGLVGGIDVGTGVLGLLIVEHATGDKMLSGVAFSIGFVALTLARSELFTEDFLVPVSTVVARQARLASLWRLWIGTLVANMVGGWIVTGLTLAGLPDLSATAVRVGAFYVDIGIGWRSFALALLGGLVITLMTWMQHTTDALLGKLVASVGTAFLLAAGSLNHVIVGSLLMFAALHTGHAPFGYLDWVESAGWAALGNIIGGVGLVTILRLLQIPGHVREARGEGKAAREAQG